MILLVCLCAFLFSCSTENINIVEEEVFSNNYEYVDLGLPSGLLWAKCNVGALSPEKHGGYYAWGETKAKDSYTYDTYELWNKYMNSGKDILDSEDDVACVKWGDEWRIPTIDEWEELHSNCNWIWTTQNGVNGYRVESKKNGNTIFLPAGNRMTARSENDLVDKNGFYWSSTINNDNRYCAGGLFFNSSEVLVNSRSVYRAEGRCVRPVFDDNRKD